MTFGLVKHNNNSISAITSAGSLAQGKMTLIKEQTASSSSSISFVDGSSSVVFDSTYPIYLFKFINIHPATDQPTFQFNLSADGGSNYNVTKTSSYFRSHHNEGDTETIVGYDTSLDLAQSTGNQIITSAVGGDNDQCMNGTLFIFNPSSTTFVKHFIGHSVIAEGSNFMRDDYYAGYGNTTSAVNAISFQMSSGNIETGTIKLYGLKDS